MKRCAYFVLSVVLISNLSTVSVAQDSLNVKLLGEVHHFVEQSYNVAVSGDYAYIASGTASGLRVLDLSDPAVPLEVGYSINSDPCPDVYMWMAYKVKVSGNYAYVLYFDGTWSFLSFRLYVYDVSAPSAPQQMGYVSLPDNCTDLFVEGDYVYVTAYNFGGFAGVVVVDVSDPMQPVEAGSFQTWGMPEEVYVLDNIAYVAHNDALLVYDVADPCSPTELGRYSPDAEIVFVHHVAVQGEYVYILDSAFGLRVLDASDFSRIEEVGSFPHNQGDAYFSSMVVSGDLLYYLQNGDISDKRLIILDVSDPTAPEEVGSYDMPGFWWFYGFDCDCERGYACVAGGSHGLRVVEVSDPGSIEEVGFYDPHSPTLGLAVSGDYAFLSTNSDTENLLVYDVFDPSWPIEVNSLTFEGRPKWISIWEDYLYVPGVDVDLVFGVSVLDISDPQDPEEIGCWLIPEGSFGVPLSVERYENYAYVATAYGGVQIYEVSEPDQPITLDNWTLWDPLINQDFGVRNVAVSWPYLFAPDQAYGLYVLDVSDPTDIAEVASYQTPGEAFWVDLSTDNTCLYLADFSGGLRIFDVSDPSAPAEVGCVTENLERANHVLISGDSLYVTDALGIGLHIFDVSDPTAPKEVAYHKTPGVNVTDIALANGLIYISDWTHFEIFEMIPEPSPVVDSDGDGVIDSEDNCPNVYNPEQAPVDRGDVDCEGGINVLDVVAVVNHILNTEPLIGEPLDRADCNGDGYTDVLDVVGLVNVILGIVPECQGGGYRPGTSFEMMEFFTVLQDYLTAEDFVRFMALVRSEVQLPAEHRLLQNYPNPFNPTTDIRYQISDVRYNKQGEAGKMTPRTTLKVYNILGQEIRALVDEPQGPGCYSIVWDGRNERGNEVPGGVYFYTLSVNSGQWSETRRMVLLK